MQVGAGWRRSAALFIISSVIISSAALAGAVVATSPSVSAAGFACSGSGPSYTVRSGDSWFGIADRVDVSVTALVSANGASTSSLLVPGDLLCLPSGANLAGACANSYTVRSGDSWSSIGARSGVGATAVARSNGGSITRVIHPGDVICLPSGATSVSSSGGGSSVTAGASYTVARGDSWAAIAGRANVSMRSLLTVNDASSSDLLMPGDVVRLPQGATRPASTPQVRLAAAPTQGPCGYGDTWGDARSRGRSHAGVDIFSGRGNYVYAVVDGRLTGRLWDGAGLNAGNAWSLTGADNTRFFYAHLADFAPGLGVGSRVSAGQIIGWVGSTGNSSASHLHLEIRPGGGSPVNPYPILRAQGGCNGGRPYTQPGGWVPDRIG